MKKKYLERLYTCAFQCPYSVKKYNRFGLKCEWDEGKPISCRTMILGKHGRCGHFNDYKEDSPNGKKKG